MPRYDPSTRENRRTTIHGRAEIYLTHKAAYLHRKAVKRTKPQHTALEFYFRVVENEPNPIIAAISSSEGSCETSGFRACNALSGTGC